MKERSRTFFPALLVGLALALQGCGAHPAASGTPSAPSSATQARPSTMSPAAPEAPTARPIVATPTEVSAPTASAPSASTPVPRVSTPEASSSDRGTTLIQALPRAGVSVGEAAPDFSLVNLGGQSVRLSDFRGQPVVVNFFATSCGPCKEELPQFQAAYQQYRDRGFQVVLVDLKESPADVGAFASKMGLTMPIVVDERGTVAGGQYHLTNLPTTVFVDASGVVRGVQVGALTGAALNDNVTALLSGAIPMQVSSSGASKSGAGPLCDCP